MLMRRYDRNHEKTQLDELRRGMWRLSGRNGLHRATRQSARWPRINVVDDGSAITAKLLVPGLGVEDVKLQVHQDVLTISGERPSKAPEGYKVLRAERIASPFHRSFRLPYRVDAEQTKATLNDGVLTIRLEKHPDEEPRRIQVSIN